MVLIGAIIIGTGIVLVRADLWLYNPGFPRWGVESGIMNPGSAA